MNVEGNPAAAAELERLGVSGLPAVSIGDRAVHGGNPSAYAALLGVAYAPAPQLSPAELAERLDRILASAERLIRSVSDAHMDHRPPERDRAIRDLAYHVFRASLAFADGMDTGRLPREWLGEKAPGELREGADIARYGALVRGRLGGWFEGASPREYARTIEVCDGPQSGHDLLERTAWHAGQHLRQLHAVLESLGAPPREPLSAAEFQGLPMPASLW